MISITQQETQVSGGGRLDALHDIDGTYEPLADGAVIILSERLDELTEHWRAVPGSSLLVVEDGKTTLTPFSPG